MSDFARRLIEWRQANGRHELPWLNSRDPYHVWVSEIMLQQTRVETVIPYYQRFLQRFPELATLAAAPLDEVLSLWSGLGYYARARNLHACARCIVDDHGGRFPEQPEAIAGLPGIGRSTAAAIAVFAFGARAAILDGNVRRVLCRHFGIEGYAGKTRVEARLWQLAESLLPPAGVDHYIQAQMDLGATVCTRHRPDCKRCPLGGDCVARREDRVGQLPTPRPRQTLPTRSARLLVLREAQSVLLEKRGPRGIWGGLLSLPELPRKAGPAQDWVRDRLSVSPLSVQPLPGLRHSFTHFRLEIEPLLMDLPRACALAGDSAGWQWLSLAELDSAPLPAPVRKILSALPEPTLNPSATDRAGSGISG